MNDISDDYLAQEPEPIPLPLPIHAPNVRPAGRGWAWLREGFEYFKRAPGGWIGMVLLGLLIMVILSMIPVLNLFLGILTPVWTGGLMLACHAQAGGQPLRINHLFAGFGDKLRPLVISGVVITLVELAVGLLILGSILDQFDIQASPDGVSVATDLGPTAMMLLAVRVLLASMLLLPVYAAAWFAPALIMLGNQSVKDALLLSLKACFTNIWSMLVYGLMGMLLAIVAIIPAGLGMLVLMPVLIASLYISFRDIFVD